MVLRLSDNFSTVFLPNYGAPDVVGLPGSIVLLSKEPATDLAIELISSRSATELGFILLRTALFTKPHTGEE